LIQIDVVQVDRRGILSYPCTAVQAGEPAACSLLVEDVQRVELEPKPLHLTDLEFVTNYEVSLCQERSSTHVAAAVDEHTDMVNRIDNGRQRGATAAIEEHADIAGVRTVPVEVLRAVQLEDVRAVRRKASLDIKVA